MQHKPTQINIAPPETLTMRHRRYLTELTEYVQGRKYITISEFAQLLSCTKTIAGQKLKGCRYQSFYKGKQFNISDVAMIMARSEKCDLI